MYRSLGVIYEYTHLYEINLSLKTIIFSHLNSIHLFLLLVLHILYIYIYMYIYIILYIYINNRKNFKRKNFINEKI